MVDPGDGFYRRFTLSDSISNSLSFLLPSSENEEFICDIRQPSFSSINITDSACSSISSNNFIINNHSDVDEINENDNLEFVNKKTDTIDNGVSNSEPEDMQEFDKSSNGSYLLKNVNLFKPFINKDGCTEHDCSLNEKNIEPLLNYRKPYTSSPLSYYNKMSISLQDVSSIDIFPLESKTTNAFSTETIQSQSMSSTTKSKDSGFQRSASCLSLNSGNRSYDHVTSKVKQYIKDIKEAEAIRKKQKSRQDFLLDIPKIMNEKKNLKIADLDKTEPKEMIKTITLLKDELEEKNTILNELQQNYNQLLKKYAEAVNQIDLMRLRTSLNYSSDINSDIVSNYDHNISNSMLNVSNNSVWNYSKLSSSNIQNKSQQESDYTNGNCYSDNINEFINRPSNGTCNNTFITKDNCDINNTHDPKTDFVYDNKIDTSLKELSPKSVDHSIPVNSVKSVTLRPISRMYSSSSRLDRKIPLLPSSSLIVKSKTDTSNNNNNKSSESVSNKNNNNNSNSDLSGLNYTKDDKSGTLIAGDDDSSVPYLNSRSISQFELPKVDPFDKVKKWQASLPTLSLIGSQSSSSMGSLENIDLKQVGSSFSSKLNEVYPDNEKVNLRRSASEQRFGDKCSFSKSDVNLSKMKNPKIYSEFYETIVPSNKLKNSGSVGKKNCKNIDKTSKSVLKRSNAVDNGTFDNGDNSKEEKLNGTCEENLLLTGNEEHLTALDCSSSLSSSVLSSNIGQEVNQNYGDIDYGVKINKVESNKICEKISTASNDNKKINSKRRLFFSENDKKSSNIDNNSNKTANITQTSPNSHSDSNFNKKHAYFSKLNVLEDSKNPNLKFAWDSTERSNSLLKSDVKNNNTTPFRSKQTVLYHRTEKLKSFTEILSYNSGSKDSLDIGIQVGLPDDAQTDKKENIKPVSTYLDHLDEADLYVRYVIKEMHRIHGILQGLQNNEMENVS